ncbi:initiation-specific alpha-1,6-mannosyltransferase [Metarhizium album ARSEF 1941]|uniref:Initiation-specific alpha-1,6-mannosyltransferase n=1 Tax=Metarhizium album (strain ARSEF 1941) TaxID=1081103 RepID=A0A0B2WJ76_METAS|nr:initiation-specific alpha-1,6-mannosyltransferase [Metarhizium album ARSEF 1941]KHN93948.1 initiation-specific alpha-1,6-mannosyltransferase [Metarhizium album ARSEF 1941]
MALPKRIRKCLPIYVGCVCLVVLLLNLDLLLLLPSPLGMTASSPEPPRVKLPGSTFPQKIWQTWKIDPLLFGITETARAMTWVKQNPQMRYEVITDASDLTYVEQHFGPDGLDRPDIVDFYRRVNLRIVKADLLRYMILYAEGGIYADIDVEAIKPFHRFIPERYNERDYDLIVGVEVDMPRFRDHRILGPKSQSFCQWTVVSRARHPVMLRLIESIMRWFKAEARRQRVPIDKVELDFDQVITGTGPSAFTAAVLAEMNKATKGPRVTWDDFHDMDESKVVGRVLVLTVEAFCAGQGHSDSGNHGSRGALVKHHYHASNWPSRHRRYTHPAYGQVEECNWDAECVGQWDKDVAAFEKLSEADRKKIVVDRLKLLQELQPQPQPQPEPEPEQ